MRRLFALLFSAAVLPSIAADAPPAGPPTFTLDATAQTMTATFADGTKATFPVAVAPPLPPPPPPPPPAYTPAVLPGLVEVAKARAAAGDPAWRAFRARLDAQLATPEPTQNDYQGSQWSDALAYALLYRVYRDSPDPASAERARDYADKAIACLRTFRLDYARTNGTCCLLVGTGDGAATRFPLPAPAAGKMIVRAGPPVDLKVNRGKGPSDFVAWYSLFLSAGDTPGAADYREGPDWRRAGSSSPSAFAAGSVDWTPAAAGGRAPAPGADYSVRTVPYDSRTPLATGWTYDPAGPALAFAQPPAAGRMILAYYVYQQARDLAADPPVLSYQQPHAGDGGLASLGADGGYTSRFVGHGALALDWLWDYPGLAAAERSATLAALADWCDAIPANGYNYPYATSNYGMGHYTAAALSGAVLAGPGRGPDRGKAILDRLYGAGGWRESRLVPGVCAPPSPAFPGTCNGGDWGEGWNYAGLSLVGLALSSSAAEGAGAIPAADAERAWAPDCIRAILHAMPTPTTLSDTGDNYAYPVPPPGPGTWHALATLAAPADPRAAAWARAQGDLALARILAANRRDPYPVKTVVDILLDDPAAPRATDWPDALPTWHLSPGLGLLHARTTWRGPATWLEFHGGNMTAADHQHNSASSLYLKRAGDDLVFNPLAPIFYKGGTVDGRPEPYGNHFKAAYANLVVIDDHGAGDQNYPGRAQAAPQWIGWPGCSIKVDASPTASTVSAACDYKAAWSLSQRPGKGGPLTEGRREVAFLPIPGRPADAYVIVFDAVTSRRDSDGKQLRWHSPTPPALTGGGSGATWTTAVGSGRLYGTVFSDAPIAVAADRFTLAASPAQTEAVYRIKADPAAPRAAARYVTVLETCEVAKPQGDPVAFVTAADGRWIGAAAGDSLCLFRSGPGDAPPGYTAPAGIVHHRVAGLVAGASYAVTVGDRDAGAARASDSGLLTFDAPASADPQAVAITPR